MRKCLVVVVAFLLLSCNSAKESAENGTESGWVSLFNGKDLQGWTPKFAGHPLGVNYKNTFRVEDGVLKISYDQYEQFNGEFGHLYYKDKFSHYRIRVEYRFVGEQAKEGPAWALMNNGIMIHCQAPETIAQDQDFPVCIEAQLLADDGSRSRTTGNVCTPGTNIVIDGELVTRHCNTTSSVYGTPNEWATMEVEVNGNGTMRHIYNGVVVSEYSQPQLDETDADAQRLMTGEDKMISEGYIAIQAETHPTEFRKIELLVLNASS